MDTSMAFFISKDTLFVSTKKCDFDFRVAVFEMHGGGLLWKPPCISVFNAGSHFSFGLCICGLPAVYALQ